MIRHHADLDLFTREDVKLNLYPTRDQTLPASDDFMEVRAGNFLLATVRRMESLPAWHVEMLDPRDERETGTGFDTDTLAQVLDEVIKYHNYDRVQSLIRRLEDVPVAPHPTCSTSLVAYPWPDRT